MAFQDQRYNPRPPKQQGFMPMQDIPGMIDQLASPNPNLRPPMPERPGYGPDMLDWIRQMVAQRRTPWGMMRPGQRGRMDRMDRMGTGYNQDLMGNIFDRIRQRNMGGF